MAVDEELLRKVQDLGDLDLAALLCLISREHCIVSTEPPSLDDLVAELQLVASRSFNLTSVVVDCTPQTTLDDLASSIQLPSPGATNPTTPRSASPLRSRNDTYFPFQQPQQQQQKSRPARSSSIASSSTYHHLYGSHAHGHGSSSQPPLRALTPIAAAASSNISSINNNNNNNSSTTPTPQIANVILAKNLDRAPKAVQIQCLELLRTRRLFTRTSVQTAPKQFLFVAVLGTDSIGGGGGDGGSSSGRLTKHLNDFFYIAHWHDPEDGFAHLEEQEEEQEEAEAAAAAAVMNGDNGGGDEKYYNNEMGGAYDDDASMESDESVVRRPQSRSTTAAARTSTPTSTMKTDAWGSGGGGYRDSASARSLWKEKSTINSTTNNTYYSATNNPPLLLSPKAEQQPPILPLPPPPPLFRPESDIPALALAASTVAVDIEVLRYQMNVISFLRMHRAVAYAGGVGPAATRHMSQLVRCLAALHGLDYATPSLVGLAARKVYPHRLRLVVDFQGGGGGKGEEDGMMGSSGGGGFYHERSVQWGSDVAAVEALLEGVGPQDVIDDVLGMVAAPL
ncbi:hypothetical protein F4810DRAFT_678853 [Camillea tinctor]|nr:hypothetical protein F4810DRAFT_678853 [Camillea tinctor]